MRTGGQQETEKKHPHIACSKTDRGLYRRILLRAVGVDTDLAIDMIAEKLRPGDSFSLRTDGLPTLTSPCPHLICMCISLPAAGGKEMQPPLSLPASPASSDTWYPL